MLLFEYKSDAPWLLNIWINKREQLYSKHKLRDLDLVTSVCLHIMPFIYSSVYVNPSTATLIKKTWKRHEMITFPPQANKSKWSLQHPLLKDTSGILASSSTRFEMSLLWYVQLILIVLNINVFRAGTSETSPLRPQ